MRFSVEPPFIMVVLRRHLKLHEIRQLDVWPHALSPENDRLHAPRAVRCALSIRYGVPISDGTIVARTWMQNL